jgi:methyl-accepting chemotaxis protein
VNKIAKTKDTIRVRIFKALLIVVGAVFVLSGLSLYAIIKAQDSAKRTNAALNKNARHFLDLRLSLEQVTSNIDLIFAKKGMGNSQQLESMGKANETFLDVIGQMEKENSGYAWAGEIRLLRSKFEKANAIGQEAAAAFADNKFDTAIAKQDEFSELLREMRAELNALSAQISGNFEQDLLGLIRSLMMLLVPVALAALVIPAGYIWNMTRKLDHELTRFVRDLHSFTDQNNDTSVTLKNASENLSSASSQQSAAVQETVASIAEIRSMLSQTANHVREVQNMTATVNDKTVDGSQIMNRMESSMVAIEQANSQLQSFEEIIRSIKEKTQIINDIVFKTQLLSFNASIEAARAGQYGRGFAVVAEEVGKLAQMSGSASKEIDQLLANSQKRVAQIVDAVQNRVRDGKEVSGEALKRFNEIAKQIVAISEKVNQVGEATLEQEGGVEQTARAMDQMDETALHNKKGAEQMFKIAERVRQLSHNVIAVTEGLSLYVRETDYKKKTRQEKVEPQTQAKDVPAHERDDHISLVKSLAQKSASLNKVTPNDDLNADDPSFRRTGTRN